MRLLVGALILAGLLACGDDAPVGIPYPPASVLVRGTISDTDADPVVAASVTAWALVWRDFLVPPGPESVGGCNGRRESLIMADTTDASGRFSIPMEVPSDVVTICIVLQVEVPGWRSPMTFTFDSLRLRIRAPSDPPRDTVRVDVIIPVM
jgi:hypothetical protein